MKQIEDYPNYFVTEDGKVWSEKSKKFLLLANVNGYKAIELSHNNKCRQRKVHRLVALAYVPKVEGKTQINHKDGNKHNNHFSNLEWCTASENVIHSFRVLGRDSKKGVDHMAAINRKLVLNTETGIYYDYAKEAAESACMKYNTLQHKLSGIARNNTPFIYC